MISKNRELILTITKIRVYLKYESRKIERKKVKEMFPNLDAEMARRKITRAMLAEKINKTATTLSLKLNGKAPLTLTECVEIKNAVNPDSTVDYLFAPEEREGE